MNANSFDNAPSSSPSTILSLDRNEYCFAHPPAVLAALQIQPEEMSRYASAGSHQVLQQATADFLGVSTENLTLGHGGEDILLKLLTWHRRFSDKLVRLDFSWQTYVHMAEGLEYSIHDVPCAFDGTKFSTPLESMSAFLARESEACVVVLTSPNNPTGHSISAEAFAALVAAHPRHFFIMDAVYDVPRTAHLHTVLSQENCFLVGSFSKFFGLPGLRMGYGIGKTIPRGFQLALGLQPHAIRACLAALENAAIYEQNRAQMIAAAAQLQSLTDNDITVFATQASFLLMRITSKPGHVASVLPMAVAASGLRPKFFESFYGAFLRWGLGPQEIMERIPKFLEVLKEELSKK